MVASGAIWLGHSAELLVAAEDCLAGVGMDTGTPGCLSPLPALGLCRAPPAGPACLGMRMGLAAAVAPAPPPSNAIPAALQRGGQGAGKCEKEKKFLCWQEVTVSLSFVHGKASALPTVKKLWSYLF